jgi:hypothetical protein
MSQQEKNNSVDVQRKREKKYPYAASNYPGEPKSKPAASLVQFYRYLIVVPGCRGLCRGAATLSQQEKNKSSD